MKRITILLLTILLLSSPTYAQDKVASPDTCQMGQTCHWLQEQGSEAYILCAGGQFTVVINGDDSILVRCAN